MNAFLGKALWVLAVVWLVVPALDILVIDLDVISTYLVWLVLLTIFIGGSVILWVARDRGIDLPLPVRLSALLFHAFLVFVLYGNIVTSMGLLDHYSGDSPFLISCVILVEDIIAAAIAAAIVGFPTAIVARRWIIAISFIYWLPIVIMSEGRILDFSLSWLSAFQLLAVLLTFLVTLYGFRAALPRRF